MLRPAVRRERRRASGRGARGCRRSVVLGRAEERLPLLAVLLPGRRPQRVAGAVVEGECDRDDAGPGHGDTLPGLPGPRSRVDQNVLFTVVQVPDPLAPRCDDSSRAPHQRASASRHSCGAQATARDRRCPAGPTAAASGPRALPRLRLLSAPRHPSAHRGVTVAGSLRRRSGARRSWSPGTASSGRARVGGPVRLGGRRAQHALDRAGRLPLELHRAAGGCAGRGRCRRRRRARPARCPSSAASPVSRLTTPPGTSLVASTSPRVTAGSGRSFDVDDDGGVAGGEHRRQHADQARAATTAAAPGRRRRRSARASRSRSTGRRPGWPRRGRRPACRSSRRTRPSGRWRRRRRRAPCRRRGPRRPRPRRRTGRAGPPSPRPRGRAPGRGCRRSCRPTSGTRRGRRRRRPGRPCGRPRRRWRGSGPWRR